MDASGELRKLQLDYIKMGTVVVAQMLHELGDVGEKVVREADADAPASKIHGSLSSKANVSKSGVNIQMRLSGAKSKGAGPAFESISGKATFRHPLFGNRNHWYPQPADPFLRPALQRNTAAAEQAMAEVIDKAASQSGW